jgi:hypothetical protein
LGLEKLWKHKEFSAAFIFFLICANFLSLELTSNEEVQFAFSRAFIDSSWLPNNDSFRDFPGTRIVFRSIAGTLLTLMDDVYVSFLLRLLTYALYAIGLSRLIKVLDIPLFTSSVMLQLFFITPQNLIAGAWIFGGAEAKTFAYAFLFLGLADELNGKHLRAIVFFAAATYLHLLVGMWFILSLLLYKAYYESIKDGFTYGLKLLIPLLPLFVYLFIGLSEANEALPEGFNLAKTYVYERVPHHTGIFKNYRFISITTLRILLSIANLILTFSIKELKNEHLKTLRKLSIIIQLIIVLSIGVACADFFLFDKKLSFYLSLYPFRQSAISLLFTLLLFGSKIQWKKALKPVLYLFLLSCLVYTLISNITSSINPIYCKDPHFNEIVTFAKTTNRDDVFLILLEGQKPSHKSFSRRSGRENFFIFQFTPHGPIEFQNWYQKSADHYFANIFRTEVDSILNKYKIDFVVADSPLSESSLKHEFDSGNYFVYSVNH